MTTRAAVMDLESMICLMKDTCEEFIALPIFADYDDGEKEVIEALVKKFCVMFAKNIIEETVEMKERCRR